MLRVCGAVAITRNVYIWLQWRRGQATRLRRSSHSLPRLIHVFMCSFHFLRIFGAAVAGVSFSFPEGGFSLCLCGSLKITIWCLLGRISNRGWAGATPRVRGAPCSDARDAFMLFLFSLHFAVSVSPGLGLFRVDGRLRAFLYSAITISFFGVLSLSGTAHISSFCSFREGKHTYPRACASLRWCSRTNKWASPLVSGASQQKK